MSYMSFMLNPHSATGVTPQVAKREIENAQYIAKALKPLQKEYNQIE